MTTDPTTSEAPAPSRFFTVLGWACILLGTYVLVSSTLNEVQAVRFLKANALQRDLLLSHLYFGTMCLLGMLSLVGGFALWKRDTWAPLLMSAAGGAWLIHCGWWLVEGSPPLLEALRALRTSQPILALEIGFSILSNAIFFIVWLIVIGGLFRQDARLEFPTGRLPFSRKVLFVSTGAGMVTVGLLYSLFTSMAPP
jgi:hypothetical protein